MIVWHWNRGKAQRSKAFDFGGKELIVDVGIQNANWRSLSRASTAATRGELVSRRDGLSPGFSIVHGRVEQVFYKVDAVGNVAMADINGRAWWDEPVKLFKTHSAAFRWLARKEERAADRDWRAAKRRVVKLYNAADLPWSKKKRR